MTNVSQELARLEQAERLRSGAKFFTFKNPGDSVEGAVVSRFYSVSPLGQEQVVYTLKTADGVSNVAINLRYAFLHRPLLNAVVGQAVKFSYVGDKPAVVKGYKPIKMIRVITKDGLIDESVSDWLAENDLKLGDPLPSVDELAGIESADDETEEEDTGSVKALGGALPKE